MCDAFMLSTYIDVEYSIRLDGKTADFASTDWVRCMVLKSYLTPIFSACI